MTQEKVYQHKLCLVRAIQLVTEGNGATQESWTNIRELLPLHSFFFIEALEDERTPVDAGVSGKASKYSEVQ